MAFDPKRKGDRDKLFAAVASSKQSQRHHLDAREKQIRKYVGHIYTDCNGGAPASGKDTNRIVRPLMWQAASTYTHNLVGPQPRFLVTTQRPKLDSFASHFSYALNGLCDRINLGQTLSLVVLDAFFGFGLVKVFPKEVSGIMGAVDAEVAPLQPYACRISPDDVVWSQSARSLRELTFVEHTYHVTMESLEKSELADQKIVRQIERDNASGMKGETQARELSGDLSVDQDYREMVKVREIWLPFERKAFVFPADPELGCMWDVEWDDPSDGPYKWLSFDDVPDNVQPISTANQLSPLFDAINSILRKVVRQSLRAKQTFAYTGGSADEAKRYKDAKDGDMWLANSLEGIRDMNTPGPDQTLIAAELKFFQDFDQSAGNLSMMAGLGPQSDTATQDKIIKQNVSERMSKMQGRVLGLTKDVGGSLGRLLWVNESMVIPYRVKAQGYEAGGEWKPKSYEPKPWEDAPREGEPDDFDYQIVPYSMVPSSPAQRLQLIEQTFDRMAPYMQLIMSQGAVPNFQKYLKLRAEYLNIPEIADLIEFVGPKQEMPGGESEQRQSPVTERHNVRHNENNPQAEGQQQVMEMLKGGAQQGSKSGMVA